MLFRSLAVQIGAHYLQADQGGRGVLLGGVPGVPRGRVAVIGAVLLPGARAPVLVDRRLVAAMKPGSVIVDVAVDQGGCVETIRATSHSKPTYVEHGVIHYGVPNMPGAVPRTSTLALNNATFPYLMELCRRGVDGALNANPALARGVNCYRGQVALKGVADALGVPCVDAPWAKRA